MTLDSTQPWFAPLCDLLGALPPGMPVAAALNQLPGSGPRFVPADQLRAGEAYEAFIRRTGGVPTRDNLHDLLNGLIWRRHPALKARLNALQAADIAVHGIGPVRGALRDSLTLFDENGAIWMDPPPPLAAALRARDWQTLFVQHRSWWPRQRFEVFGHALLEQLSIAPRKGLTAHVAIGDPLLFSAEDWAPNNGAQKPFFPLPVLGIPGWWPANQDPAFYDDSRVFRRPIS